MKRIALVSLLSFLALMSILQIANAATITSATLDKEVYLAGQTGSITVSVHNDESDKIKVTELSASVSYYYTDGTVYVQKFFTSATLPDEIEAGQTETYQIPISLPTNIAPGYVNPTVEAKTDLWSAQAERWMTSDRPTYQLKLYIESPYKQSYEDSQEELGTTQQELETAQGEIQELETLNGNLNNLMITFAVTTMVFAVVAAVFGFLMFGKRAKPVQQP